jgi:hypothetical protein
MASGYLFGMFELLLTTMCIGYIFFLGLTVSDYPPLMCSYVSILYSDVYLRFSNIKYLLILYKIRYFTYQTQF